MLFQPVDRVVYKNNPLQEVVCQLKFPPVLKLRQHLPTDLQEIYLSRFGALDEQQTKQISITYGETVETVEKIDRIYNFSSPNGNWTVSVTSEFLALSTRTYKNWEEFKDNLDFALKPFLELYKPVHLTRLGLRYVNAINPRQLGLEAQNWENLLNPAIAGCVGKSTISSQIIKDYAGQFSIDLDDNLGVMMARYGMGINPDTQEQAFLIDADFFAPTNEKSKIELGDIDDRLSKFKDRSHWFFRWTIQKPLHDAMEPSPYSTNK